MARPRDGRQPARLAKPGSRFGTGAHGWRFEGGLPLQLLTPTRAPAARYGQAGDTLRRHYPVGQVVDASPRDPVDRGGRA